MQESEIVDVAEDNIWNALEANEEYERRKAGRSRLYRGLRGIDVACAPFEAKGKKSWSTAASALLSTKAKKNLKANADKVHGRDPQRAEALLRSNAYFESIAYWKPKMIQSLAKVAVFIKEPAGQVLFRQHDMPKDCYVLLDGVAGLYEMPPEEEVQPEPDPSPSKKKHGRGSTSSSLSSSPSKGMKGSPPPEPPKQEKKVNTPRLPQGKTNKGVMRYQTYEKTSTYSDESDFGNLVVTLTNGTVIGERALLEKGSRRACTVKLDTDCELLVITHKQFEQHIAPGAQKLTFFNSYLPLATEWSHKVALREIPIHPSNYFRENTHKKGHHLLYEGLNAEPALFLITSGTVAIRRRRTPLDNLAYRVAKAPLRASKSTPHLMQVTQQTLQQRRDLRLRQGVSGWEFGSEIRGHLRRGEDEDYVDVTRLGEGDCFASMAVLPMPGTEPFSVVVVSETCTTCLTSHRGLKQYPLKELEELKKRLAKRSAQWLRDLSVTHPEVFGAEAVSDSGSLTSSRSWGTAMARAVSQNPFGDDDMVGGTRTLGPVAEGAMEGSASPFAASPGGNVTQLPPVGRSNSQASFFPGTRYGTQAQYTQRSGGFQGDETYVIDKMVQRTMLGKQMTWGDGFPTHMMRGDPEDSEEEWAQEMRDKLPSHLPFSY